MTRAEILQGLMQDASGYEKPRLFIGGPLDGKYMTVSYRGRPEPYCTISTSPRERQTAEGAAAKGLVVQQERYHPQVWTSQKTSVVLMVHESVPSEEVMPRLVAGYLAGGKTA